MTSPIYVFSEMFVVELKIWNSDCEKLVLFIFALFYCLEIYMQRYGRVPLKPEHTAPQRSGAGVDLCIVGMMTRTYVCFFSMWCMLCVTDFIIFYIILCSVIKLILMNMKNCKKQVLLKFSFLSVVRRFKVVFGCMSVQMYSSCIYLCALYQKQFPASRRMSLTDTERLYRLYSTHAVGL